MIDLDNIFTVKPEDQKIYNNFVKKLEPTSMTECWDWNACKHYKDQRPMFWFQNKWQTAARAVLYFKQGYLTEGLYVCHDPIVCNNRTCVNPFHLREDTASANTKDLIITGNHNNQRKTHCPKKHEYSEDNTYYYRGRRFCKTCKNASAKEYRNDR